VTTWTNDELGSDADQAKHDRYRPGPVSPDEVGTAGALLMGAEGAFITGSDFLMDGSVTASYFYGELAPRPSHDAVGSTRTRGGADPVPVRLGGVV
jgi:hypothetical protein